MMNATSRGKPDNGRSVFTQMESVVLAVCLAATLDAAEVNVGFRARAEVDVASGETLVQTDAVVQEGESRLFKTGAGTWQLPYTAFRQKQPFDVGVREGTLELSQGTLQPAVTRPTALLARAAFWISARDDAGNRSAKLVVTNGVSDGAVYVARWCDERETNVDVPTLRYAFPDWSDPEHWTTYPGEENTGVYGEPPTYVVTNGAPGVYFGGYASGKYLQIQTMTVAGGVTNRAFAEIACIRDIFCVHSPYKTFGYVLGNADASLGSHNGYINAPTKSFSASSSTIWTSQLISGPGRTGWTFLDGVYIENPCGTYQPVGTHLLSVKSGRANGYLGGFFTNQRYRNRQGGDYLNECIVFTNELTAAERQSVTRYLMHKWNLEPAVPVPGGALEVAEGATARLTVAEGGALPPLALKGAGRIVKDGAGAGALACPEAFRGTVRAESGTLTVTSHAEVPYELASGDRLTVTQGNGGTEIVADASAGDGSVVIAGGASVRVTAIPASVGNVAVNVGTLALAAPRTPVYGELVPGRDPVVANGDLESVPLSQTGIGKSFTTCPDYGWKEIGEHGYYWSESAYSFKLGPYLTSDNLRYIDIQGNDVLIYNTVALPRAGYYDLTFDVNGREYYDLYMNTVLFGASAESLQPLAQFKSQNLSDGSNGAFMRVTYHLPYAEAGTYVIGIRTDTMASGAGGTLLDNFSVAWRSPVAEPGVWEIPNGDFETVSAMPSAQGLPLRTSVLNVATNWTFVNDIETANVDPQAGLLTQGMVAQNYGTYGCVYFNNSRALGLSSLMMVTTGGLARTTFRPPAGTWRLRGDLAVNTMYFRNGWDGHKVWNFTSGTVELQAGVTAGGAVTDLGTGRSTSFCYRTVTWPNTFTVDGETDVTLELKIPTNWEQSLLADNFVLVAEDAAAGERLENGGFESGSDTAATGWTVDTSRDTGGTHYAYRKDWSWLPAYVGYTTCEGSYCMAVVGRTTIAHALTFAVPGIYRLSYKAGTRHGNGFPTFAYNPLRAVLAQDGAPDRVIGLDEVRSTNFVEHAFLFSVPAAGDYTLRFEGQANGDHMTRLDAVSVKRYSDFGAPTPSIPEATAISVAAGAKLRLDFPGTNRIGRLSLGGCAYSGLVTAARCPDFIFGPGALEVPLRGTVIIVR